ncbi:unnamed protein product [Dovyalis caffra]|uniref:Uncharacterized protein n=1 Tax=Dovyalis caffra TaxID=77055 RepID=A0AAV1SIX0_9ROSI|nr:unnamed protein product [Dovyalis caffra]
MPCNDPFHVNCGGQDVKYGRIPYEGDQNVEGGAAKICYRSGSNWGFSSTGDFMDGSIKNRVYTLAYSHPGLSMEELQLYSTAHDKLYYRVGKRFFDIYIQQKAIFNASVTDNTLEIRLYWAGRGTACIPSRGNYGPIISSISVCSGRRTQCQESEEASKILIVAEVVTPVLFLVFLGELSEGICISKKGNLMEIMGPKLHSEFNQKEAERMIKVALLCTNASPSLRPTMSGVVSMLDQEVISDPSIMVINYSSNISKITISRSYTRI